MIPMLSAHGAQIPTIGFGTSQLGAKQPGDFTDAVATALKLGYRHIDTAWKYGSEPAVGIGIKKSGVPRKDIFLTTKVSHENLRAADFARSVDESLKALRVDYIDLLLVHWPSLTIPLAETMQALAKAKRVAERHKESVRAYYQAGGRIAYVQGYGQVASLCYQRTGIIQCHICSIAFG